MYRAYFDVVGTMKQIQRPRELYCWGGSSEQAMVSRKRVRHIQKPHPKMRQVDIDLFEAIRVGRYQELRGLDAVRAALEAGGDVNAVNPQNGATPLFMALAWGGWVEAVELLIKEGADPTHVDNQGRLADEQVMAGVSSDYERAGALLICKMLDAARKVRGRR